MPPVDLRAVDGDAAVGKAAVSQQIANTHRLLIFMNKPPR
jgi:hypothetical protein